MVQPFRVYGLNKWSIEQGNTNHHVYTSTAKGTTGMWYVAIEDSAIPGTCHKIYIRVLSGVKFLEGTYTSVYTYVYTHTRHSAAQYMCIQ
jgi:hypothetical protein